MMQYAFRKDEIDRAVCQRKVANVSLEKARLQSAFSKAAASDIDSHRHVDIEVSHARYDRSEEFERRHGRAASGINKEWVFTVLRQPRRLRQVTVTRH